jgi:anti-sigma factor RsiW
MGNLRCKWVRDRLPLLVGEELRGLDRRRVERHLIGCPQCRQHQASLGEVLGVLRTVAATTVASLDAPSLWPALARQIRESRRPVPSRTFPAPLAWLLAWPRANPWPVLGLGLALLAAISVGLGVHQQSAVAQARIAVNSLPIRAVPAASRPHLAALPVPRPNPGREVPRLPEAAVVESTPAAPSRLDFDLEGGRPMPPESREPRDTKNTY